MSSTRRRFLRNALSGASLLALRSLATGIPVSILANPRRALASTRPPQFIILSSSVNGDPVGTNAPGTYLDPEIAHPASPQMAPTELMIGGQPYTAALPWSQLPQSLLNQTCFFHHATYTVVHPDEQAVMALEGNIAGGEMLMSLLASQLAPALSTVQAQPVVLGPRDSAEAIYYQGTPQPTLAPAALAEMFGTESGMLGQLSKLRDSDLNKINALIKSEGTPAQAAFVDQYVISQTQLRSVSQALLSNLQAIPDNSVSSQITAAVTLIRMNVAPVVSIHIPFGGDNHADPLLATEVAENVSGIAALGQLWSQLQAVGLQDRVSFLSFNVFGRTMAIGNTAAGRDHNANHHLAVMFGAPFKGSVIGGVEPVGGDYGATSIDSATGLGVPNNGGDVYSTESLQAMALTFGAGVGVDPGFLASNITGGKPILPALV